MRHFILHLLVCTSFGLACTDEDQSSRPGSTPAPTPNGQAGSRENAGANLPYTPAAFFIDGSFIKVQLGSFLDGRRDVVAKLEPTPSHTCKMEGNYFELAIENNCLGEFKSVLPVVGDYDAWQNVRSAQSMEQLEDALAQAAAPGVPRDELEVKVTSIAGEALVFGIFLNGDENPMVEFKLEKKQELLHFSTTTYLFEKTRSTLTESYDPNQRIFAVNAQRLRVLDSELLPAQDFSASFNLKQASCEGFSSLLESDHPQFPSKVSFTCKTK